MKFRKKSIVINADQWFVGKVIDGVIYPVPEEIAKHLIVPSKFGWIKTLEGGHFVDQGDWIITGIEGEKYPCKPKIFAKTYEPAEARPKIVCLCGSSRFCSEMAVVAWGLEKDGYITLGLHLLPAYYTDAKSHIAEVEGVAEKMDELHLRKIDLADVIFVVNKNGYIGDSTRREIEYATKLDKPIKYLEP